MSDQNKIPVSIYRGGTSKGIFFLEKDIPPAGTHRDKFLLRILGKPDPVEIDGIGGGRLITSKVGIISKSNEPGIDVNYTFAQVEIDNDIVDYSSNCGNVSAAVAAFAVDQGLISVEDGVHNITVFNTNTRKKLYIEVPVMEGEARAIGDYHMAGIPGTGADIYLDFRETVGANTGKLLPTGKLIEEIRMEDGSIVHVSIVDVSMTVGHVQAEEMGIHGNESVKELLTMKKNMHRVDELRAKVAQTVNMIDDWKKFKQTGFLPFIAIVSPPQDYTTPAGENILQKNISFLSRLFTLQICHPTYSGTASCATAVCAALEGTVLNPIARPLRGSYVIGHPGGEMPVKIEATHTEDKSKVQFQKIAYCRTARRLIDGVAYIPENYDEAKQHPYVVPDEKLDTLEHHR